MKLESHSISNGTKQYNEPDVVAHPCDPTSQGAERGGYKFKLNL